MVPPAPIPTRSNMRVVLATAQPLFSPPIRSASATTASSKNTSLKSAWPVISTSGRMVTPGWSSRNANHEIPACLGTSTSVRASNIPRSASMAPELQTFWPVITQWSPSRVARVDRPARSEPDPGSLNSWHHATEPS
jgi:hypothetical protein